MPRRVADYSDRFADVNLVVSIASFVLGASMVIFFYNVIVSWARGPIAASNPWRAMTLEWQVTSPPPVFNFDEIPQVVGGPYEYGVPGAQHAILSQLGPRYESNCLDDALVRARPSELIPTADRDRAVLAAFESLAAGLGFVLVSDHDPESAPTPPPPQASGSVQLDAVRARPNVWRAVVCEPRLRKVLAPFGGDAA